MAMFHLLKIRTSIDIFKNEKCKVTFGLEYRNKSTFIMLYLSRAVQKPVLCIREQQMRRLAAQDNQVFVVCTLYSSRPQESKKMRRHVWVHRRRICLR